MSSTLSSCMARESASSCSWFLIFSRAAVLATDDASCVSYSVMRAVNICFLRLLLISSASSESAAAAAVSYFCRHDDTSLFAYSREQTKYLHPELHQHIITVASWSTRDVIIIWKSFVSFSVRIVNIWNSLPASVNSANNVNTFKNRRDRFWTNQELIYNYKSTLIGIRNRSSVDNFDDTLFSFIIMLCTLH